MKIQAIIFDLDGTVLDNEGVWEDVFREVADRNGIAPLRQGSGGVRWLHQPGIGIGPNWKKIVKDEVLAEKLTQETWLAYPGNANLQAGFVDLIEEIKDIGWQTALATGTAWHIVEKELEELELTLAFEIVTTGEEVLAQKPDPEIYILTARKLGIEPENCVVIEDSLAGVTAGVEAGMTVIGMVSEYASGEDLQEAGAKEVVDSLAEVMLLLRQDASQEEKS